MFSNFESAFLKKNEIDKSIPAEIVEALSEKLPGGFKYTALSCEACGIIPTTPQFNLEMKIDVPEDLLKDFKPLNTQELMEFIYRTQRELKVIPDEEGCISVNNTKLKIEDMIRFPFDDETMVGAELSICPEPFQPPFYVPIEGGAVRNNILIQRQPYADMHKSFFKNVDDSVLEITYILDEVKKSIKFTFRINIEKSKNAKKILDGLKLYQSCLKGEVKFAGIDFSQLASEDKAIEKTIEFWDRIHQLEKKLNVEFLLEFPIKMDATIWVEKLYRSFIEEKPYKKYTKIDKITIGETEEFKKEEIIGNKPLTLHFAYDSEIELWGVKLNLFDSVGIFDFKVSKIVHNNTNEYELLLEPTTDKGIYESIRHFAIKEEAINYKNCLEDFKNAELINLN
jgi:hypothetical protein